MSSIQASFKLEWPGFTLDVDLTLPNTGVTALFGHSGSGKTTLLRCIAGLERAQHGHLVVGEQVWQDEKHWLPPHKRPIGYVFQEASLFPHLSVMGNLRYGMKRAHARRDVDLEHVIDLLGIAPLLDRKPGRLSGGERQRVGIARALALGPELLLMDEPLAALDLQRKQEILPYLERLHEQFDIPILYVSHAPNEVARLADYIVAMQGGKALASGPIGETLARLDLPIPLGEDVGAVIDAQVGELDNKWLLMRVDFPGGSLWARNPGFELGRKVRVHVHARDVSIAEELGKSSIQNALRGRVDAIADDEHPGLALVRVELGGTALISRLTKRSMDELQLEPGKEIWAQVKSVALIE